MRRARLSWGRNSPHGRHAASGETVSHYLNHIDGQTVDLTAQQFPPGTRFTSPIPKTRGMPSTREYCLSYDGTRRRYELLSARVVASLRSDRRS
ncbi:YunG family protein [Nocardia testacea]|uniref:YunG family protein n=1 Tax=Nocardia testacea TaxID=248551 RepID=UPI003C2C83D3